ncbi:related to mitochondrial Fe2+ transporter MMT1 and related transporters (cation diffusion facilitator superfamily) [Melanopsichium pennsylvanicum]|uniref:Related to mitochondrial Fe2+ transporter MMT1 and related transporters (Cation diffusion facilitator superfamily) n=2 Tax=Melanopsichium pennsylvanicum TaxID=63383 RepID=A0AAJ4XLT4_9BASI|nr:cdf-like metal transporter [Melanopsichium pennsylvanicum 4]SNX85179.1 related to mitochondrial Fe2+ transporter MMT1 and related transporters (cation diffusion facilitator superfamily) [Melanopsichium pennsylvanicum]
MSHIISSAMSVAQHKLGSGSDDTAHHQPGLSPPLSPDDNQDIELTAPTLAATRHNSRPHSILPSSPLPPHLNTYKTNLGNDITVDVNIGPSTSSAYARAQGSTAFHHAHKYHAHSTSPAPASAPLRTSEPHIHEKPTVENASAPPAPSRSRASSIGYAGLGPTTPNTEETDPLLLRSRLVEESEIRRRHSGKGKNKRNERQIRDFYEAQNEHIERLLKPIAKHADEGKQDRESSALKVKIAVYASIAANFALAALQLYAAISSLSLSLFATAADSVFDPFANLVLNWLHRKSENVDDRKWPIGGSRFEPIGNITYAALMGMVSAILVVEAIQELATGDGDKELHIAALIAVGIAFVTKGILAIYCFGLRKYSSQVEVLYQDHRNDIFINGFGIFTSAAGATIAGWIDPAGALIISLVIITSWTRTAFGEFKTLAGAAAPTDFLQLVTYNAALFSEEIQAIESVRAYSSGPRYIVEIDIVMHPETPLWKSHDLSQALQDNLESLPMVDRAFIHVDHEIEHAFEHRKTV